MNKQSLAYATSISERYMAYPKAKKKSEMDPYKFFTLTIQKLRAMGEHRKYSFWPMRELVLNDYEAGLTPDQSAAQFFKEWN
ncbi:hypothetical protein [Spirosoma sp. 48-14]|uniref:hypothetical protein n=1 Tax=Spirosoma sp. 48-14 TaxID=1895854 RepID=UPI00095BA7AE|nr:hypothetical protein [Spirosoma sp. 48-14]OJW78427.1 MAG: hypothetical protein BGO59_30975 [Spirosoma sp. 48-14]